MKAFCQSCGSFQPATFRAVNDAVTSQPFEDLCCQECHLIIASVESRAAPVVAEPTLLKPFTPCVCHDETAKRYCKDKGKCSYFEAHGIGGQP